jgi:hypothetical protein
VMPRIGRLPHGDTEKNAEEGLQDGS